LTVVKNGEAGAALIIITGKPGIFSGPAVFEAA
jgi:hypothetical protein